jgi:NAD(P)H-hydrate repair Nnr-like enzyme with NAD(P)H-hydrate dehydratase domain
MAIPSKLHALELIHRLKREPSEHKGNAGKVLLWWRTWNVWRSPIGR